MSDISLPLSGDTGALFALEPKPAFITRSDPATLRRFFTVQFFCLIYLQKLAVTVGSLPSVSLPLMILLGHLGWLAISSKLCVRPLRVAAYALFAAMVLLVYAGVVIQGMDSGIHSMTAATMLLLIHTVLVVGWDMDQQLYDECVGIFVKLMIVPAGIVLVQLLTQFLPGVGDVLNMEHMVPSALLQPGYIYAVPFHFGHSFIRPNGFFMLEPSFVSICLACSIILEMTHRRRLKLVAFFASALVGCMGGSGVVMMVIASPFLLARQRADVVLKILALAAVVLIVSLPFGVLDQFLARSAELNSPNTSGWQRLVQPVQQLGELLGDPRHLFTGVGPGNDTSASWPISKVGTEYGMMTSLLYLILIITCVCTCANLALNVSLFCVIQFTGGYLVNPVGVELVFLLCAAMVLNRPDRHQSAEAEQVPMLAAARS